MLKLALPTLIFFAMLTLSVNAYFNATFLNTTIVLNENTSSAHVVESLNVYISNSSVSQYQQYRQAINLTLSKWQNALQINLLFQHILNPKSSVSNFTFLPGPISYLGLSGAGNAQLTMSYYVSNIVTVSQIAPRKIGRAHV